MALTMMTVIAASAVLIWRYLPYSIEVVSRTAPAHKPELIVPKDPVISYVPVSPPTQLAPPQPDAVVPEPAKKRAKPKPKPTARTILQKKWGAKASAPSPGFLAGIKWPSNI